MQSLNFIDRKNNWKKGRQLFSSHRLGEMSRGNFKFSVGKIIRVLTLGTKNGRIS
jgi:hypothetical protein